MEATPVPESSSRERGAIVALPTRPCTRTGFLGYRRQRAPGAAFRVIRKALPRETTLREQARKPDKWLSDYADWLGRGCLS